MIQLIEITDWMENPHRDLHLEELQEIDNFLERENQTIPGRSS